MKRTPGLGTSGLLASLAAFGLLASSPADAQEQWSSVAKVERTEVFVNPSSIKRDGAWLSVRTKQNFLEPQPSARKGKSFLSARNEYRIDCGGRRLAYRELQAYADLDLQGAVIQKTRIGEKNLKWMDAPEHTVFGELLDYACKNAPPAPAQGAS
jgi:Surface-adhesin protein E